MTLSRVIDGESVLASSPKFVQGRREEENRFMVVRRWLKIVFPMVCLAAFGCDNSERPGGDEESVTTAASALTGSIQNDFEDGTNQGWSPRGSVTLSSSTAAAYSGTRSLLVAGRSAAWMGPSLDLTGQLVKGSTYQVKAAVKLAAGQAATTVSMTVQRTASDGSTKYDSIVYNATVTDTGWVLLSGNYQFTDGTNLTLYLESASATASFHIDAFSLSELTSISSDFEDGTAQGWGARGSVTVANSTDVAATGTHSLKVTNRTATWNGLSYDLFNRVKKGASYQVTISGRLVAGAAADTMLLGVQRTTSAGTSYDTIKTASVTDAGWVTLTGVYSFTTDVTAISLYVQTNNATPSFYIDSFNITLLAPAPGLPANTDGASMDFESSAQGWVARGSVALAQSQADKHSGNSSLLTTGRTATWMGPSLDVTNFMYNGSRYRVSMWVKLAPGMADNKLRVSLERKLGTTTDYTTIIPNAPVTAGAWVRLTGTFDLALANSKLTMYVESDSSLNNGTSDFYIDDVSITYVQPAAAERNIASAYQSLASYFPLGAAVDSLDITGERAFLLSKHFNSIVSGNDMKWTGLQNAPGTFTFTTADAQVAYAKANGMQVRGHTLIWHNQTPAWVFNDASGNPLTATQANQDLLTQRIQSHIQSVVTHFGNDVPVWDVLNEVIDENQPDGFRRSVWFNVLGPQYIDIALRAARAAAPNAKLYINDYNTTIATKRTFLAQLVSDLKSRGVPVDGVGHQMHNNVEWPSAADVVSTINLFDSLGVENEITELDISIYSGSYPQTYSDYWDVPSDRFALQGYQTRGYFDAFKQLAGKIKRVTFWGVSDDRTWLSSGSKIDAPLLFDASFKAKPEYWAIVDPMQLPGADLSVNVLTENSTTAAGQPVTFNITVKNNPDSDTTSWKPTDDDLPAVNVQLVTSVPDSTAFQALEVPVGWSCTTPAPGASGPISCSIGTLAVGTVSTLELTVGATQCSTPDGAQITATAKVTSSTRDPNTAPNNSASASGQVSNSAPVVSLKGEPMMSLECTTAFVDPGAAASDTCQGDLPVTSSGEVNSSLVGSYVLSYSATDLGGGHAVPVTRTVNVVDTMAPALTLVGEETLSLECRAPFVDPGATAIDLCQGLLPVIATGSVNSDQVGSYALGYAAVDAFGNAAVPTARVVNVVDRMPPVIALAGSSTMTVECRSAFSDPGASASDDCTGTQPVSVSGSVNASAPASYTLSYSAADPSGNATTASRNVVVQDTSAPAIEAIDLTILAPFGVKIIVNDGKLTIGGRSMPLMRGTFRFESHLFMFDGTTLRMDGELVPLDGTTILLRDPHDQNVKFTIADLLVAAKDACDPAVDLSKVVITRVSSDEREERSLRDHDDNDWFWGRVHRAERDIAVASDCRSVLLRDERDVRGNGRVYTIELKIRDASGNEAFRTVKVMVPTKHHAAEDDGPAYTVTSTCL